MKQDLVDTLAQLQRRLADEYRLVPVDVPDSPIFLAVAVPLRPGVTGLKPRLPSGRGTSLLQAMVSAGAEALELRSSLAQNHVATIADLRNQNGHAVVQARDLLTGDAVPVAGQEVYLDFAETTGEAPYFNARSTGCATGMTMQDAVRTGLFECIERDAIAFWWHGGTAPTSLSRDLIDLKEPRLSWWLEKRGRKFQLLGLCSDIGLPVVLAVSSDCVGRHIAYGAAARFDPAAAALSAVTEMIQTEVSFDRALKAGNAEAVAWLEHGSTLTFQQFDPPTEGPPPSWQELNDTNLLQRLDALGLRALVVDLNLPDGPLPSVRVMVPGLCDMDGRINLPRFRQFRGLTDPQTRPLVHAPEPF